MTHALSWRLSPAIAITTDTSRVKSFVFATPWLKRFRPGQHVDVRLTAPDGYRAQRSYSIASEPERAGEIELTIELLAGGEVSSYFHEVLEVGDEIEMRGPIGGPFTWTSLEGGPLLLIGGGSGIVPLMSMLRHRRSTGSQAPALLLFSCRTQEDVIYADELQRMAVEDSRFTLRLNLTRTREPGPQHFSRRIDAPMLDEVTHQLGTPRHVFVCGSNGFVEAASDALQEIGIDPTIVATERFGPTGA